MSRPPLPIGCVETGIIKRTTGVGLQVIHHTFARHVRIDDDVNMIGADMRRKDIPPTLFRSFEQRSENGVTAGLV